MRKIMVGLLGVTVVAGGMAALAPVAFAQAPVKAQQADPIVEPVQTDNLPNPLADKRRELTEKAVSGVLSGRLTPQQINGSQVVKVSESNGRNSFFGGFGRHKDQYVELDRETHRPDLRDPGRVRRRAGTPATPTRTPTRRPRAP